MRFVLLTFLFALPSAQAVEQGPAFTYQGELRNVSSGLMVDAAYDFEVLLFDSLSGGNSLATQSIPGVAVRRGLFSFDLDFTAAPFELHQQYWIELRLKPAGAAGGYQQLLPRQPINSVPYSVVATTVREAGVQTMSLAENSVTSTKIGNLQIEERHLSNGAVSANKIAPNAVSSASVVDGSITALDVQASSVQRRIASCSPGQAIQAVAESGSVNCLNVGTGTVQQVGSGFGLLGGPILGQGSLSVDPTAIQVRINGTCGPGSFVTSVAADGSLQCGAEVAATGTVTSVATGFGLVGGPLTTVGTIAVDPSEVQQRITGSCPAGYSITSVAVDGSVSCSAPPLQNGTVELTEISVPSFQGGLDMVLAANLPRFVWVENAANFPLRMMSCASEGCSGVRQITTVRSGSPSASGGAGLIQIEMRSDGKPVIAFRTGTDQVRVVICGDASCSSNNVERLLLTDDTGVGITEIELELLPNDVPVVAAQSLGASVRRLKLVRCTSPDCASSSTIVWNDVILRAIAAHAGGGIAVAHVDNDGTANVRASVYRVVSGVVDAHEDLGPTAHPTSDMGVGFASSGAPMVVLDQTLGAEVKVISCGGGFCSPSYIGAITAEPNGARKIHDALFSASGLPVVVYSRNNADVSQGNALKVARCSDLACDGQEIISGIASGVTLAARARINQEGLLRVAYVQADNKAYFRFCADTLCL